MNNFERLIKIENFDEDFNYFDNMEEESEALQKCDSFYNFKEDYFTFYDDLKHYSLDKQDW